MVELIIRMDDKGQVQVGGPIQDKVLCYGLLEVAKDAIKDFKASPIITPGVIPNLRSVGNKE